MKRTFLAASIALLSLAASAGPPVPSPATVHEKVIPFAAWGSNVSLPPVTCVVRKQTPFSYVEVAQCDSVPVVLTAPLIMRAVIISPNSADTYLDGSYRAASCGVQPYVSIDGGVTFKRFGLFTWTPGNFQTTVYELPVPIAIPAGATLVRRVDILMWHGNVDQGCVAQTRIQTTAE